MSLDAKYLLVYESFTYIEPTPMRRDMEYLKENYGGDFLEVTCSTIYWDKPKYTLLKDELENLMADQVLEMKDGELWKIIK